MKKILLIPIMTLTAVPPAIASLTESGDARTDSMGGAGIAASYGLAATRENPAMLLSKETNTDIKIMSLLGGTRNGGDTLDDLDELQTLSDQLDTSLTSLNSVALGGAEDQGLINTSKVAQSFATTANRLEGEFAALSFGIQSGVAVAPDDKRWAAAIAIDSDISVVAFANNITEDTNRINGLANVLSDGVITTDEVQTLVDNDYGTLNGSNFEFNDGFLSQTEGRAVAAYAFSVGISYATQANFYGKDVAIGITPKLSRLGIFEINERVSSFDSDNLDEDFEDKVFFTFDLGVSHELVDQQIMIGAVIKNIVGKKVSSQPSTLGTRATAEVAPKIAVGVAKNWGNFLLAADIDLTEQEFIQDANEGTQFLSLGAEGHLARWVSLRLGYKTNLASSNVGDMLTAGLGFLKETIRVYGAAGSDDQLSGGVDISIQL